MLKPFLFTNVVLLEFVGSYLELQDRSSYLGVDPSTVETPQGITNGEVSA